MVHGPGPWGGPWIGSMGWSMFCIRPPTQGCFGSVQKAFIRSEARNCTLNFFAQMSQNVPAPELLVGFRQMYEIMETLTVAFLARPFPSNTIRKFFYLGSVVFNL